MLLPAQQWPITGPLAGRNGQHQPRVLCGCLRRSLPRLDFQVETQAPQLEADCQLHSSEPNGRFFLEPPFVLFGHSSPQPEAAPPWTSVPTGTWKEKAGTNFNLLILVARW